jgi:hypothetical protein
MPITGTGLASTAITARQVLSGDAGTAIHP